MDDSSREDREDLLNRNWGFNCTCSLCKGTKEEIEASDTRRSKIQFVKEHLERSVGNMDKIMKLTNKLLSLYDEEGLYAPRARYNEVAAYAASAMSNEEEAKKYAGISRSYWEVLAGKDSWEAKRMAEFEADPKGHPSWGSGE
jgi:hypothetical protein